MGFFDFLFKKKKEELTFGSLEDAWDFFKKEKVDKAFEEIRSVFSSCEQTLHELEKELLKFSELKLPEDADEKLKVTLMDRKANFVNSSLKYLRDFKKVKLENVEDLSEAVSSSESVIKGMGKLKDKYHGILSSVFWRELNELYSKLHNFTSCLDSFFSKVKEKEDLLNAYFEIGLKFEEINKKKKRKESAEETLRVLDEELKEVRKKLEKVTREKEELLTSEEYKVAKEAGEELKKLRNEFDSIKLKFNSNFSSIKKYLQALSRSSFFDESKADVFHSYILDPFETFLKDNHVLFEFIDSTLSHINALDIEKKEKAESELNRVSFLFKEYKEKLSNLSKKIRELESKEQPLHLEKTFDKLINDLEDKIASLEKRIKDKKDSLATLEEGIAALRDEIVSILSSLGLKIENY